MSGQPTPPRIVEAFAINAGGSFINYPIPATTVDTFAASLDQGFPPSNFLDPADGGALPSGADFNGILRMISAWAAYAGAGQRPFFDATLAAAMGGYAVGAELAQLASPGDTWTNTVDGNATNPDMGGAGWISSVPLHSSTAPTAGIHTDVTLPGVSDYFIDVDTTAGNVTFNGIVAQRNAQRVTYSCTGAGNLTFGFLAGTPANQIRASGPSGTVIENDSFTIEYCAAISRWVVV